MVKKIILLIMVFIASINIVSAEPCYQETATSTSVCGGLSTGSYAFTVNEMFDINYTKPTGARSVNWTVKHSSLSVYNISIPSVCWEADENKVMLRIRSNSNNGAGASLTQPYCYNGTSWVTVGTHSSGTSFSDSTVTTNTAKMYDGDWDSYSWWDAKSIPAWVLDEPPYNNPKIYEEAVWWDINTAPTTPSGSSLSASDQIGENLVATGAGSTDDGYPTAITYYYEFRCDAADGDLLQAYGTDTSWTIDNSCGKSHTVYVNIKGYDGELYSEEYETETKAILNTAPTTASGSSLSASDQIGENLVATGAGSTDVNTGDSVTYYYEFRCDAADGDLLQAYGTDTSWTIDNDCGKSHTVYVNIKGYDGTDYGGVETETKAIINTAPTTPSGSSLNDSDQYGEVLLATGTGSTDVDTSDSITYYYEFRCDAVDGDLLQAKSTTDTYTIDLNCSKSIYVNIWSNDGTVESSSYETEIKYLLPSVISNISTNDQLNTNFTLNTSYYLMSGITGCSAYSNNSDVTCSGGSIVDNSVLVTCSFSTEINENVTITPYCTNGTVTNATSKSIYLDNTDPLIVHSFTNLSRYFKENMTAQFNFSDAGSLYRWNITVDGSHIDGAINPAYNSYIYNLSYNTSGLSPGVHYLVSQVADGHTANELREKYTIKYPLLARNEVTFKFPGDYDVNIVPKEKKLFDSFRVYEEKDRYRFVFDSSEKDKTEHIFTVKSDERIEIVNRPKTKYKEWLVIKDHWLDFYLPEEENAKVSFNRISDKEIEVTISNLKNGNSLNFNSVGDLNIVTYNFTFYTINSSATYTTPVLEYRANDHLLTINTTGTPYSYNEINATLSYNGTNYTPTKTSTANYIYFAQNVTAPKVTGDSEDLNFTWNISVVNQSDYLYNLTQTVISVNINNCSNDSWVKALTFHGRDESTGDNISDMKLNVNFDIHLENWSFGSTNIKNFSFAFDGLTNYSICIYPNTTTYTVDSIMEYGDGDYSDRKYYLNNYTLSNVSQDIYLYHLNDTLASDIITTVIDGKDGTRLDRAYIKTLRYYPETNTYKTVEIERTDTNGETLIKMVLADVFYKFIVEKPPGTILLNGNVEKMKTTTKTLVVNTASNPLDDIYEALGINYDVSCTKSTKTCRFTWSNPTNVAITGRLTIFEDTGYSRIVNYTEEVTASAASIVYTFTNITDKNYIVEGAIIN